MDATPSPTPSPTPSTPTGTLPPRPGTARHFLVWLVTGMLDGVDEGAVLWAAMAAMAAIGPFTAVAAYAVHDGLPRRCPPPHPATDRPPAAATETPGTGSETTAFGTAQGAPTAGATVPPGDAAVSAMPSEEGPDRLKRLDRRICALDGRSERLEAPGGSWEWTVAVRHQESCLGYLVVRAPVEPSAEETDLARLLARQTGVALRRLVRRGPPPGRIAAGPQSVSDAGAGTGPGSVLASWDAYQNALFRVAASGEGEQGILLTLHEFTGLPAFTEDLFGNVRACAGPRPRPAPAAASAIGCEPGGRSVSRPAAGTGFREEDRLVVPVEMAGEPLGLVGLADPGRQVVRTDVSALEVAALALAPCLFHERKLAALAPQLRRDLVERLISGTETDGASVLASTFGHDLRRPHRVVALRWADKAAIAEAVGRAAGGMGLDALVGSRGDTTVALVAELEAGNALYRAVADALGNSAGAVGVGGRCAGPDELPRSYDEAVRALTVQSRSQEPHGSTDFEELGLCRLMGTGKDQQEADRFVREWLGTLLGYDTRHHTDLVTTLSSYLESGGSYDTASLDLHIHRSTLRYRLQRIGEITGYDLADVETRLNLHVAIRVRRTLDAS